MDLLPASITLLDSSLLILTAGLTSLITAAMGIGGGVLLLAIMATIVPVTALIPVHGLVQLGSNGNRAWMTRQHTDWALVKRFILGAVLGALIASFIVVQLPLNWIQFSVAAFILYLVWGPKPGKHSLSAPGQLVAGAITTVSTIVTVVSVVEFVHFARKAGGWGDQVATSIAVAVVVEVIKAGETRLLCSGESAPWRTARRQQRNRE